MQLLIKSLIAFSAFIESLAFRLKCIAIERLEAHKYKIAKSRDKAIQARSEAWDREVARHEAALQRIQSDCAEAEAECAKRIAEDDHKIKQIGLA